ncbi:MAG: DUF5615 family PIN-like protein [Verrucomicrobiota bacterium]
MKFLVDAHLPKRLSLALNAKGHDSVHTLDLPKKNKTKDGGINAISLNEQRVVISKDADFIESLLISDKPYKLLYISTGNISNKALQQLLENNMPNIEQALASHRLVELTPSTLVVHQ